MGQTPTQATDWNVSKSVAAANDRNVSRSLAEELAGCLKLNGEN